MTSLPLQIIRQPDSNPTFLRGLWALSSIYRRPKFCHTNASELNTKFTRTNGTIARFCKLVPHRDDNAECAENKYCNKVDEPRDKSTIEAVVKPRHKRTHCQQRDTAVVKSAIAGLQ